MNEPNTNINQNHHMNVFEHYNKENTRMIENNLTRALAICLHRNELFYKAFMRSLYERIQRPFEEAYGEIDIQVGEKKYKDYEFDTLIAITLTVNKQEEADFFDDLSPGEEDNSITDLLIHSEDVLVVCEVKRWGGEGVKNQLKQQIDSLIEKATKKHYLSLTWLEVYECSKKVLDEGNEKKEVSWLLEDFNELIDSNHHLLYDVNRSLSELSWNEERDKKAAGNRVLHIVGQIEGVTRECFIPVNKPRPYVADHQVKIEHKERLAIIAHIGVLKREWNYLKDGKWKILAPPRAFEQMKHEVDGIIGRPGFWPHLNMTSGSMGTTCALDVRECERMSDDMDKVYTLYTDEAFYNALVGRWYSKGTQESGFHKDGKDLDTLLKPYLGDSWKTRCCYPDGSKNRIADSWDAEFMGNSKFLDITTSLSCCLAFEKEDISKIDTNEKGVRLKEFIQKASTYLDETIHSLV